MLSEEQYRFKDKMVIKRFSEEKEPKFLTLQENPNGEPFLSIVVGKNRIAFKLSKGECAELGLKLITYAMQ